MSFTFGPIFNAQNGKIREWSIVINLFDKKKTHIDITDIENQEVEDGYYTEYYTVSGYQNMKMTQSANTTITIGKNIGKKNETTVLTQAYKECKSKYAAKIKAGYTEKIQKADKEVAKDAMPFPMAVKSWKDHGMKLKYPLFIQPKLDGIRLLARMEDGKVKLYTRRLHDIVGFDKLKNDILCLFKSSKLTTFIIDGELYCHGMNLQTISGIVRNESISEEEKEQLKYHVFDIFDIKQPMLNFKQRYEILERLFTSCDTTMVSLNPTNVASSETDAEKSFKSYVKDGYEGVIYKSSDKPYEFDFNKEKRSGWYLKRKKQDDDEFPIVGYTSGKGKDIDCIVFQLEGPNKKIFNCVPNGTYEYRKELFKQAEASFDTSFKGKLAKVVYDDLSKDGIPLRGRIVQIGRDLAFD